MKTNRILKVACLLLLLALIGKLAYNHNLWNIRGVEPSDLYRRYEHADGISAAFIKDYRVSDAITLDVTLLQATDSAGWQQLTEDFEIPAESVESAAKSVAAGRNVLTIVGQSTTDTQIPVASYRDKYICAFHTRDREQKEKVKLQVIHLVSNSVRTNQKLTQNEEND